MERAAPSAMLRMVPLPRKRGRINVAAIRDLGSSPAKRERGTAPRVRPKAGPRTGSAGGGGGVTPVLAGSEQPGTRPIARRVGRRWQSQSVTLAWINLPPNPLISFESERNFGPVHSHPPALGDTRRIALTGTRVMNRMLVEGGRCRVGRMTVCGLGFCHDIRAPGGQAQRECCHVRLRASMPAGRGKPGHIIKLERLGPAPRFPP